MQTSINDFFETGKGPPGRAATSGASAHGLRRSWALRFHEEKKAPRSRYQKKSIRFTARVTMRSLQGL